MVLDAIRNACQDYYDALPHDIVMTIGKSAGFSFTVALYFTSRNADGGLDLTRPLLKGGVAALASTIHALTAPLFNKIFPTTTFDGVYELVKSCFCAVAASALVGLGQNGALQLSAFKLFYLISGNSFFAWTSSNQPYVNRNSTYICF